jgi:hypothetical protein
MWLSMTGLSVVSAINFDSLLNGEALLLNPPASGMQGRLIRSAFYDR